MKSKFFWYIVLFLAISLFGFSLMYQQPLINFIVIILALCIFKYGDDIIFAEFNKKRTEKKRKGMQLTEATRTIMQDGRLFKKGRNNK